MKKIILPFLAAVFSVFVSSSNASAIVNVEGRYWFTDLDDSVQISSASTVGTDIDLVNDTGLDDKKNFWEGRLTLELGSHSLRYAYTPLKWNGSKTITRDITFGGTTYSASADVESELSFDYHRLGYEYDIIDTLNNKLGIILEVKYLDGKARLKTATLDQTESFNVPIPAVGVAAQVGLPFFISVGGEVTGIALGNQMYLIDGEAGVNISPMPFVTISGGYRIFKLHVEHDNDKGDLTLKGPFVMLRADF